MKLLAAGLGLAMLLATLRRPQDPSTGPGAVPAYPFLLLDSPPHYFTMREIDVNYLTKCGCSRPTSTRTRGRLSAFSSGDRLRPAVEDHDA
jgi:hypothetical protein